MVVNINEELETKITSGLRTIYTVEDRYYNLKQIERSIIRDVFGKEEGKKHSLEDCLAKFRKLPSVQNSYVKFAIRKFEMTIDIWNRDKQQIKMEIRDRKKFQKILEKVAKDLKGKVLFDLRLPGSENSEPIDAILIVPSGIYLLNLFVLVGDAGVDEDGYCCWFDVKTVKLMKLNVREELEKQKELVKDILAEKMDLPCDVFPRLIVGGDDAFNNRCSPNVRCDRLPTLEKNLKFLNIKLLRKFDIVAVSSKLQTSMVKEVKKPVFREPELVEAYCQLKGLCQKDDEVYN